MLRIIGKNYDLISYPQWRENQNQEQEQLPCSTLSTYLSTSQTKTKLIAVHGATLCILELLSIKIVKHPQSRNLSNLDYCFPACIKRKFQKPYKLVLHEIGDVQYHVSTVIYPLNQTASQVLDFWFNAVLTHFARSLFCLPERQRKVKDLCKNDTRYDICPLNI